MRALAFGVLTAAAVLAAGGCGPRADSGREVARRLDEAIRAEVPAAATRAQAEAWLDARGLPHWYVPGPPDRSGGYSKPELAGLQDADVGGMICVSVTTPHPATEMRPYGRLEVYFFFDRQGACIGHLVDAFEYSL